MTDMNPSRLGQINANGDDKTLFLKVYGGEVLTAFAESTVTHDRHIVRTIQHGKSAQFPATWKAEAFYHKPGKEILGQQIKHGERVIAINDLLISPVFIANIDEAMTHYDVRSIYSKECGAALARHFDQNVLKVGILGARETKGTIDAGPGGKVLEVDVSKNDIKAFIASIFEAAQILDEKDVPSSDRYLYVRPELYYRLVQDTTALNKDWGGVGSYSDGKVIRIAGIQIVETNNLPSTDTSGTQEVYKGNFSKTIGLILHKTGVGTVKLLDLSTETDYLIQFQGNLTVAKMAIGHGLLRPEACIELMKKAEK